MLVKEKLMLQMCTFTSSHLSCLKIMDSLFLVFIYKIIGRLFLVFIYKIIGRLFLVVNVLNKTYHFSWYISIHD